MQNPTMLFKAGSELLYEGRKFDTITVDADDVQAKLEEGYYLHPHDVPAEGLIEAIKEVAEILDTQPVPTEDRLVAPVEEAAETLAEATVEVVIDNEAGRVDSYVTETSAPAEAKPAKGKK